MNLCVVRLGALRSCSRKKAASRSAQSQQCPPRQQCICLTPQRDLQRDVLCIHWRETDWLAYALDFLVRPQQQYVSFLALFSLTQDRTTAAAKSAAFSCPDHKVVVAITTAVPSFALAGLLCDRGSVCQVPGNLNISSDIPWFRF